MIFFRKQIKEIALRLDGLELLLKQAQCSHNRTELIDKPWDRGVFTERCINCGKTLNDFVEYIDVLKREKANHEKELDGINEAIGQMEKENDPR